MNELNKELQGKGIFARDLYLKVKSFQTKLTLFENKYLIKVLRTFLS